MVKSLKQCHSVTRGHFHWQW